MMTFGRTDTLQLTYIPHGHNCWQNISNTNILIQMTYIPQLLAVYIQYNCISHKMHIPQHCVKAPSRRRAVAAPPNSRSCTVEAILVIMWMREAMLAMKGDVDVVDVMMTVSFLTGQGHISKVIVLSQVSKSLTLPLILK